MAVNEEKRRKHLGPIAIALAATCNVLMIKLKLKKISSINLLFYDYILIFQWSSTHTPRDDIICSDQYMHTMCTKYTKYGQYY